MQQLPIQLGSPGSPLPHCNLQPQGRHIQTSLYLLPFILYASSVNLAASHVADSVQQCSGIVSTFIWSSCWWLIGPGDGGWRCCSAN